MTRWNHTHWLLLLVAALICAGCGKSDTETADTSAPTGTNAADLPESEPEKGPKASEEDPVDPSVQKQQETPPLAVAPFDATAAGDHQESWSRHMGQPVEVTNSIGMKLTLIPPGEFMMGSPDGEEDRHSDEGPQHRVRLTRPYYLGVYEVTQGEYERVMGTNPSSFSSVSGEDTSRFPVENVSWEDAMEFCRKLSALASEQSSGRVYRLPTEAEWEYACRAGTTTPFHFGPELTEGDANYSGNLGRPTTVGSYASNAFGLYDMHGNVFEWCSDRYDSRYYGLSAVEVPTGPATGSQRVNRGGGWRNTARYARSAHRLWIDPSSRGSILGFRLALSPSGE